MTTEDLQEELAEFCADLPRLRKMLKGPASAGERLFVEQVIAAARAGRPISPRPPSVRNDYDSVLNRLVPADGLPTPVDSSASGPVGGCYVCPGDTCSRLATRGAGGELPTCGIHEQALRFVADE